MYLSGSLCHPCTFSCIIHLIPQAVLLLLKSWTGLIAICSDRLGLKALVEALELPSAQLREIVIDGVYEILKIGLPKPNAFRQSSTLPLTPFICSLSRVMNDLMKEERIECTRIREDATYSLADSTRVLDTGMSPDMTIDLPSRTRYGSLPRRLAT